VVGVYIYVYKCVCARRYCGRRPRSVIQAARRKRVWKGGKIVDLPTTREDKISDERRGEGGIKNII